MSELEAFLRLADVLHYGRASRACFLSPSALSRIVVRLEREVGHALIDRSRRSIQLTTEGKAFREFARDTLLRWEEVRARIGGTAPPLRGDLTLYGSVTAGLVVLPPLLERFRQDHPGVTIHLRTGDTESAIERVQAGDVDVAVAIRPDSLPKGLRMAPLARTELEFVAPRVDCAARAAVKKKRIDWATVPFIVGERGVGRQRVDKWFGVRKVRPLVVAQVAGSEAILGMVALGFGVGVVSRLVLDSSTARHQVECLQVKPRLKPFEVLLVARRLTPVVRAFVDLADNGPIGDSAARSGKAGHSTRS